MLESGKLGLGRELGGWWKLQVKKPGLFSSQAEVYNSKVSKR